MMTHRAQWYLVGILCLAAVGTSMISHGPAQADGLLHVYFLNVGQGDSMLIQTPDGTQVLIDGGPGRSVIQELAAVMPPTDRTIDAVIATHSDADHITGLVEVLKQYEVGTIIETGMTCVTVICTAWKDGVKMEGATRQVVARGHRIAIGDEIVFEVLSPAQSLESQTLSKTNNGSIVLKLTYGENTLLLTGDIEQSIENQLLQNPGELDVDFLKVAHHGSKTSSTQAFLDAASPVVAFIQVGGTNRYGHPSPQTIERLDKIPALRYYRTDIDGRIELLLDLQNYAIKSEHDSH